MWTRPTRATQGATQEESRGQNDREKGEGEESEREKEMRSTNRTAKSTHAQTQKEIEDPKQGESATRKKITARTKHAREFLKVSMSPLVLWRILNEGSPFIVFVVVLFSLSFLWRLHAIPSSLDFQICTRKVFFWTYSPPVLLSSWTWSFVCASMLFRVGRTSCTELS